MANVTVIGSQWGDEGKGKIVDWLASRADAVVRFQGGHNAGHTLVVGEQVYKLSLLPSGIVTGTLSIIGNGVVLDPWALRDEMAKLRGQGVEINADKLVRISRYPDNDGELRVLSTGVKVKAKVVGDAAEVLAWCRQAGRWPATPAMPG